MATKKRVLKPHEVKESELLKQIVHSKKKELNFTQETLAERMNISQGGLNHYLNGINPLNPAIASQFARELNITVNQFSQRLANEINEMAKTIDEYKIFAPNVNNNIISGNGHTLGSITKCNHHEKNNYSMTYKMPDSSLNPVIPEGSELWVDENEQSIIDGKIYLIEYGGVSWYRRLFQMPNNQISIRVFTNQDFSEYTVAANEIKIIGRVTKWLVND